MCSACECGALEAAYLEVLGEWAPAVESQVDQLAARSANQTLWARKGTLWTDDPHAAREIEDRLGWLELPQTMQADVPGMMALADAMQSRGMERAVLLGMGGSSLAPEVLYHVFRPETHGLELIVLDATDPAQIQRVAAAGDLSRTLFIAASKSGTTAETRTLLEYFGAQLRQVVGERWAKHIIAISDPGTPLLVLAEQKGFAASYAATPDVGGRYSALTAFGLVPGALIGVDLYRLLEGARVMAALCGSDVPERENPAFRLGATLGLLAQHGHDKLTLVTSPRLRSFGWWAEQLIAESTGKDGKGIVPVEGESVQRAEDYGSDRLFAYVRLRGDDNAASDAQFEAVCAAGHPVVMTQLDNVYDLGGEFFRWELATAVCGLVLGINPFDQPNVEEAKDGARDALVRYETTGSLDQAEPLFVSDTLALFGAPNGAMALTAYMKEWFSGARSGDYVALTAYIDRTNENQALLQSIRDLIASRTHLATTVGFGPRFLHSTGQLHKGGKNNGLFIQITQADARDLDIPGRDYSFGILKSAQASGDMASLEQRGRRVVRLQVGTDVAAGLSQIRQLIETALI